MTWANALRANQVHVVLQTMLESHPELKGVPLAVDYANTDEGKKLLRIASELYGKQRLYSLPPQVPEQRVRTLQKAFISTLKDPQFLAEAEKAKLEIDPIDGPSAQPTTSRAASGRARLRFGSEFFVDRYFSFYRGIIERDSPSNPSRWLSLLRRTI